MELSMFKKTVHPLDLLLAVLAAVTPGAAIFYWLAINGRLPFDFLSGLLYLLTAVSVMLASSAEWSRFALWFFSPGGEA
jgi:hypothetical protein